MAVLVTFRFPLSAFLDYSLSMNVLLLGSRGFLGERVLSLYPDATTPSVDIADTRAIAALLDAEKPDVVLNCAGKTGRPNVDWCEEHKAETLRSNVTGSLVLLDACASRGIYWVQFSSGCIYAGDHEGRGWSEDDPPNFDGSYYSRTKAWCEQMLKDFPVLILRPRMPFDGSDHPRNLLTKLRGYSKVLDAANSLTYLPDLLDVLRQLVERRATGIYNVVNPGPMSPYAIMERYKAIVDPSHTFERLPVQQLGETVKTGRSNCMLSTAKLEREGITLPTGAQRLEEALREIADRSGS